MTRYALIAETDAFGELVRAEATAHPKGWTVTTRLGTTELGTRELGSIPVLEAAEELVLMFTSLLMTIDIGRYGGPTSPPRPDIPPIT
jgi:hypothetical protein